MRLAKKMRAVAVFGAVGLVSVGLIGCAANNTSGGTANAKNNLEITSWWTSGSEVAALDVLINGVKAADKGLTVSNAAVSGGGGANARQALAARLQAGDPPASWQIHPGGQLKGYVDGKQVADISALWKKNGWEALLPKEVAAVQRVDGKYYTVPIGVHRGNVVWTNPAVLKAAGVTINATGTVDEFITGLNAIKASGVTPVCLGDKDVFASSELLESILMSRLGASNWNALFTGKFSFKAPEVAQALADYKTILSLSNSDHAALTWDEAAKKMATGACGVNIMGDWAYGELVNAGNKPGENFGWATFPGAADIFDYVGDGFSIPAENNPNSKASEAWLKVIMDPKIQTAFAAQKGSIPALSTADTSSLSKYQQEAVASFKTAAVVSSLTHGQASTGELSQTYADAVSAFNGDNNAAAFVATMSAAQATQLTK